VSTDFIKCVLQEHRSTYYKTALYVYLLQRNNASAIFLKKPNALLNARQKTLIPSNHKFIPSQIDP